MLINQVFEKQGVENNYYCCKFMFILVLFLLFGLNLIFLNFIDSAGGARDNPPGERGRRSRKFKGR